MRVKRGIGIAVPVVAVLAAAWLAAPHVLDWATHTWYTVVKDRDLRPKALPAPRQQPPLRRQRCRLTGSV